MPMPNRQVEVAAIVDEHDELFALGEPGRLELLKWICGELNLIDEGHWGLLEKPGPKIPSDVIVWEPSLEHVDVLTDSGPTWIPKGVIQPSWAWIPAPPPGVPLPEPVPPAPPDTAYPDEPTWWAQFRNDVAALYAQAGQPLPPVVFDAGRWFSRTGWDIRDAGQPEAQKAKHLAELKAELGL